MARPEGKSGREGEAMAPEAIKVADSDSATDSIGIFAVPDTTITGPILHVTATTNYKPDTFHDVTAITFATSSAAMATFKATQFGSSKISKSATITGDSHADTIKVDLSFSQTFNGSHLHFSHWTSSDHFDIDAEGGEVHIEGTSENDVISIAGSN